MKVESYVKQLYDSNQKLAYHALKQCMELSQISNQLYCYFDQFVEMMRDVDNSFIRTRGLRLIAYQAKWDIDNKINMVIQEYLEHIEDEKPITARQCIQDTVMIAKFKPELIDIILLALETYTLVYKESMQSLIYKDRKQAMQRIRSCADV